MIAIQDHLLTWTPVCTNKECRFVMKAVTIDLDAALHPGNQCPRCLTVLDLGELAQAIKAHWHPEWCQVCWSPLCADSRKHA